MTGTKLVQGVYAAAATPRHEDGTLDEAAFRGQLEFLMERGIQGFAVNGATGEFCLTTPAELERMVAVTAQATTGRVAFVCGVGAAGLRGCVVNGRIAMEGGAKGLLLPAPYFFPYEQDDLDVFCRRVAAQVPLPGLLYNLPQFTSGFQPETVVRLIAECPNIVGIKDSSGALDSLRALSLPGLDACRIVGNDSALVPALAEQVCDGVISGVACVLPELLLAVYERGPGFDEACRLLGEFIAAINGFPVPWALKWIGESRGIAAARFAQPLSGARMRQGRDLQRWFEGWRSGAGLRA
jgi:4-hydroxy-tetrahydrodipicolinate synthase